MYSHGMEGADMTGMSGVPWDRTVSFLEYCSKRVYCLPKEKRPCRHQPKAFSLAGLSGATPEQGLCLVQGPVRHRVLNPSSTLGGAGGCGAGKAYHTHYSGRAA